MKILKLFIILSLFFSCYIFTNAIFVTFFPNDEFSLRRIRRLNLDFDVEKVVRSLFSEVPPQDIQRDEAVDIIIFSSGEQRQKIADFIAENSDEIPTLLSQFTDSRLARDVLVSLSKVYESFFIENQRKIISSIVSNLVSSSEITLSEEGTSLVELTKRNRFDSFFIEALPELSPGFKRDLVVTYIFHNSIRLEKSTTSRVDKLILNEELSGFLDGIIDSEDTELMESVAKRLMDVLQIPVEELELCALQLNRIAGESPVKLFNLGRTCSR